MLKIKEQNYHCLARFLYTLEAVDLLCVEDYDHIFGKLIIAYPKRPILKEERLNQMPWLKKKNKML